MNHLVKQLIFSIFLYFYIEKYIVDLKIMEVFWIMPFSPSEITDFKCDSGLNELHVFLLSDYSMFGE